MPLRENDIMWEKTKKCTHNCFINRYIAYLLLFLLLNNLNVHKIMPPRWHSPLCRKKKKRRDNRFSRYGLRAIRSIFIGVTHRTWGGTSGIIISIFRTATRDEQKYDEQSQTQRNGTGEDDGDDDYTDDVAVDAVARRKWSRVGMKINKMKRKKIQRSQERERRREGDVDVI